MEPKSVRVVFLRLLVLATISSSFFFTFSLGSSSIAQNPYRGRWKLLKKSIGVSAMHMALLPTDRIITYDWTNCGPSNITFPDESCLKNPQASLECYAHSIEFDPANRNVRPLRIRSDTWCSSGSLSPDGTLIQTGGYQLGERVVRFLKPCQGCDWVEDRNGLLRPRWYASNQLLPDGKIIVVGGRDQFSYEFIPKTTSGRDHTLYSLPFLEDTRYLKYIENNLYPFLHLSPDGNLFIFANDRAILLDYVNNKVVRNYPVMLDGISHNYPSTGSSALLPLKLISSNNIQPQAEVLVCGGTQADSFLKAAAGTFLPVSKSCGRLMITDPNPKWVMEEMPLRRIMGDMILLPTGDVLIINGAGKGTAGWYSANDPVLNPVLYKPDTIHPNERFEVLAATKTPRLYHSTAHLLSDGRVLVGGSNPNSGYNFSTVFPTELSIEAFYPPYLSPNLLHRPTITAVNPKVNFGYKQRVSVGFQFKATDYKVGSNVYVTMVAPSFTTHSFSMNQRVLVLAVDGGVRQITPGNYAVDGFTPATAALAPPGYYQLFVVHEGVPSRGKWVHIK